MNYEYGYNEYDHEYGWCSIIGFKSVRRTFGE
jgi:hypothetical protein